MHGQQCAELCHDAIESLTTEDGVQMYHNFKEYRSGMTSYLWHEFDFSWFGGKRGWWTFDYSPLHVYKLNPALEPF